MTNIFHKFSKTELRHFIFGGYTSYGTSNNFAFVVNENQLDFYPQSLRESRSLHRSVVQGNNIVHFGNFIETDSVRNHTSVEVWQWNGETFDQFLSKSDLIIPERSYIEGVPIDAEEFEDAINKQEFDVS